MDKVITINKETAKDIVSGYKGNQFFSVTFVKRSLGTTRKMNCRKGVHKGVTGAGQKYDPASQNLVCVRDVKAKAYRMIPLENIVAINITGRKYQVK